MPEAPAPNLVSEPIAATPAVELEVMPDQSLNPVQAPASGDFEQWLMQNVAPLLVILGCITSLTLYAFLGRAPADKVKPPTTLNPSTASVLPKKQFKKPTQEDIDKLHWYSLQVVIALAAVGGCLACLVAVVAWVFIPESRRWIHWFLKDYAVRALPALRALDLIASLAVLMTVLPVLGGVLHTRFAGNDSSLMAMSLILTTIAWVATLMTAILLSRHRVHGKHGSIGIWPFWTQVPEGKKRSLWYDVGLGVLAYPLTIWMVVLCLNINRYYYVEVYGGAVDDNPLMDTFAHPQPAWVMAVVFITATVGAGFFEELFFRGVVYNVLRRYFGAVAGAFFAAVFFASVHQVWTQVLGLFMLALVLTWLYDRTGRLVAGMTFHFLNNLITLLAEVTK